MENENNLAPLSKEELLANFTRDISFSSLDDLAPEYFTEKSESMETIKLAATEFLEKFAKAIRDSKTDIELKAAKDAFASRKVTFERIVGEKRDQLLAEDKQNAIQELCEKMAIFPPTYTPDSASEAAVKNNGLLNKIGFNGGVEKLQGLPEEFWVNQKLYNAVLNKVSLYLRGYGEKISNAISKKDISTLLAKFKSEFEAFEDISTKCIAKAEVTVEEAAKKFENARASALKDANNGIKRVSRKYHHTPAQDFNLGRDYKC